MAVRVATKEDIWQDLCRNEQTLREAEAKARRHFYPQPERYQATPEAALAAADPAELVKQLVDALMETPQFQWIERAMKQEEQETARRERQKMEADANSLLGQVEGMRMPEPEQYSRSRSTQLDRDWNERQLHNRARQICEAKASRGERCSYEQTVAELGGHVPA